VHVNRDAGDVQDAYPVTGHDWNSGLAHPALVTCKRSAGESVARRRCSCAETSGIGFTRNPAFRHGGIDPAQRIGARCAVAM
jgi:hypothetical protein